MMAIFQGSRFCIKVTKGAAKNSYGLNVAKIAGIPQSILKEAANKSEDLKDVITQRVFHQTHIVEIIKKLKEANENEVIEIHKEACKLLTTGK